MCDDPSIETPNVAHLGPHHGLLMLSLLCVLLFHLHRLHALNLGQFLRLQLASRFCTPRAFLHFRLSLSFLLRFVERLLLMPRAGSVHGGSCPERLRGLGRLRNLLLQKQNDA